MKKLITWLSKGNKIIKILKQVYRALIVINSGVSGSISGMGEVDGNQKITDKLTDANKYLDIAIGAIAKVLDWVGVTQTERDALAKEALTTEIFASKVAKLTEED